MPFIDSTKRINIEEFRPEDREVAERIATLYNFFVEQVTNTINGNLDYDNFNRSVITLDIVTSADGTPTQTTRFAAPVGLTGTAVINAVNSTARTNFVNNQPFISFTASGDGTYTIDNVKGLLANNKYTLTIELIF